MKKHFSVSLMAILILVLTLSGCYLHSRALTTTSSSSTKYFAYVAGGVRNYIYAYSINATTGALTVACGSPFATSSSPQSITVDPIGKFAYVTSQFSNNISIYSIDATTGALTKISDSPCAAGLRPLSITMDPTGKFTYVTSHFSNNISVYSIDATTGALTEISDSPFAAGLKPQSVTVDPTGKFAYVANLGSNNISTYSIDATTGSLRAINGSPFAAALNPKSVTVDPTGKFAYVANHSSNNVSAYSIDATTGALTEISDSPFAAGLRPLSVTVDPTGKFAYVVNFSSNNISAYSINATSGALTSISGSPFDTVSEFSSIITVRIKHTLSCGSNCNTGSVGTPSVKMKNTNLVDLTRNISLWTWVSGDISVDQIGVYGTKGVAAATNKPGGRVASISWTDSKGNLYLFGGFGYDSAGSLGWLNDLWKYDRSDWTWVSGDISVNQIGAYGTKGVAAATNKPGSRCESISWTDSRGNFWLFGGNGNDSSGTTNGGYLNDLWKYDGTNWTWVSGDNTQGQLGVYGTKRVTSATNKPGARIGSISWMDSSGNLWLFGGRGFDGTGIGYLNDLWKFDGANWTWVSGDSMVAQNGVYGTKKVAAGTNKPGARSGSISWIDSSGNLWLLGGGGFDRAGNWGCLNDLWKYDGVNWTWVSGDSYVNQIGAYGTKGVAAVTNKPGARFDSISWMDKSDNLWLFGGIGYDNTGKYSSLNDLWKFDRKDWIWISGDSTVDQSAVNGTKGIAAATNKPGARFGSISWMDSNGNLWLFGGRGQGVFNDLWKVSP